MERTDKIGNGRRAEVDTLGRRCIKILINEVVFMQSVSFVIGYFCPRNGDHFQGSFQNKVSAGFRLSASRVEGFSCYGGFADSFSDLSFPNKADGKHKHVVSEFNRIGFGNPEALTSGLKTTTTTRFNLC